MTALLAPTASTTPLETVPERHDSRVEFNVMAGKPVSEAMHVREYRVGHRYVEAVFDREYHSSMTASPSHLIFLSVQVHCQKMLYLALCKEFGFDYEPDGPEKFKMWPTKIDVRVPELVDQEQGLVQQLWVKDVKKFNDKTYRVTMESRVGSLSVSAVVPTFLL